MSHKLTRFQWQVLKATTTIPLEKSRSYQWIAQKTGKPKAVRAVGQALRRNPYPLTIPCHRVIKSDGSFGGYEGKYSNKKEKLLELERNLLKSMEKL